MVRQNGRHIHLKDKKPTLIMEKVDQLDLKILKIITVNARIPFKDVAAVCGVSRAAIHQRVQRLIEAGVINGGMIPKVQSCLHALDEGCSRALILDGRQPSSLRRYLLDGEPLGTVVTA